MYKIYLKNGGNIIADQLDVPPNPYGGVRELVCNKLDQLWTGAQYLVCTGSVSLPICGVLGVYWRSSLDEDNEPWTLVGAFDVPPKAGMPYPTWDARAKIVENFAKRKNRRRKQ